MREGGRRASEFVYLPKRRRKVGFDSGPNFWSVLSRSNAALSRPVDNPKRSVVALLLLLNEKQNPPPVVLSFNSGGNKCEGILR